MEEMMDKLTHFFTTFNHWSWWVLALVLLVIELALPGVFFLWLGIAAAVTGFVALIFPSLGWEVTVTVFAVLGVIAAILGRRFYKPGTTESSDPTLNQRAAQYIGQLLTLDAPIVNGHGRVVVADGTWLVAGPDLPPGTRVRVTGVEGGRLRVEAAG